MTAGPGEGFLSLFKLAAVVENWQVWQAVLAGGLAAATLSARLDGCARFTSDTVCQWPLASMEGTARLPALP